MAAPFYAWLRRVDSTRATAFLLVALLVPALFLETAWFEIGPGIVRWPVVVMAVWTAWIAWEMRRPRPVAPA